MNILLCDDNPLHLEHTQELTESYFRGQDIQIQSCLSVKEAEALLDKGAFLPQIAILDIELPDGSGLELAQQLNRCFPHCRIIFLTAFACYASDAYLTEHVWYVMKGRINEYLPQALERAVSDENHPALVIRQRHSARRLPVEQVYYIERVLHQTKLVTIHGTFTVRQTPEELLEPLEENCFIHCHRSFWVNPAKIAAYANNEFHMLDGCSIPISRSCKKAALELFRLPRTAEKAGECV